jgi:hypothetical protein
MAERQVATGLERRAFGAIIDPLAFHRRTGLTTKGLTMVANAIGSCVRWVSRRIVLVYALGGALFLTAAGAVTVLDGRGCEERLLALSPRHYDAREADALKQKIRDALAVLPGTLAKIGVALLGVAAVGGAVRSIERRDDEPDHPHAEDGAETARHAPRAALDLVVPVALAALVFVQVAGQLDRPLKGDELENYQDHLKLPLKGVLTSMRGANNQLGFTILAWTSIRAFGDSPFAVRLPALLGAMVLPGVAYLLGARQFGRGAAALLGLLLAVWPDTLSAAVQGRSYSLLMLVSVLHVYAFENLVTTAGRRAGLLFAATLAVACTLHMWFVMVIAAELLFLALVKVDDRLGTGVIGLHAPLRVESFLGFMTLGALGAAALQAGILHKFLFILTQKSPSPVDARVVLASMANCLRGASFEYIDLAHLGARSRELLQSAVGLLALVGLAASAYAARRSVAARFEIAFFTTAFAVAFLMVYVQKPVYLYSRFFMFLPMILAWAAARGWGSMFSGRLIRIGRPANVEPAETV